jgi:hypothetical protein
MTRRAELEAREYETSISHVEDMHHKEHVDQDRQKEVLVGAKTPQKKPASIPPTAATRSDSDIMPSIVLEAVQQRASRATALDIH